MYLNDLFIKYTISLPSKSIRLSSSHFKWINQSSACPFVALCNKYYITCPRCQKTAVLAACHCPFRKILFFYFRQIGQVPDRPQVVQRSRLVPECVSGKISGKYQRLEFRSHREGSQGAEGDDVDQEAGRSAKWKSKQRIIVWSNLPVLFRLEFR